MRDEGIREGGKQEQPMQLSRTHKVLLKTEPERRPTGKLGDWRICPMMRITRRILLVKLAGLDPIPTLLPALSTAQHTTQAILLSDA